MTNQTVVDDSTAAVTGQAAEIAADVEASAKGTSRRDAVTLSNGVILKLKPIPQLALREVIARFQRPTIPEFYNEDKGRVEENPNHPDYLAALERYQADVIMAANDVYLMLGSQVESVPEGMDGPDSQEWVETREALGIDTAFKNRLHRYLLWLKTVVLTNPNDVTDLIRAIFTLNGTTEIEVQEAAAAFRNQQGR